MGILRGGGLIIVSVLLFAALFVGNLLFTISWSLNFENVEVEMKSLFRNVLGQNQNQDLSEFISSAQYQTMLNNCKTNPDYVFDYGGKVLSVPCSVVNSGRDTVLDYGVGIFVRDIYYDHYDCSFIECFGKSEIPFFLVSKKAQDYFYEKFNLTLMFIGFLTILGFLLADTKTNFLVFISISMMVVSLPFAKLDLLFGFLDNNIGSFLTIFFSKAHSVFLISLTFGVILLAVALIFKFFNLGVRLSKLFFKEKNPTKDDVKKMVKEEIKSELKKGSNQKSNKKDTKDKK